jgi:hypothetical protein
MPEQRIAALEQQLLAATGIVAQLTLANTEAVAKLTQASAEAVQKLLLANAELTTQLSGAESRFKKLKRNARSDESSFRSQLATAQSRRG